MKEQVPVYRDFTHTVLSVLFICLLIGATFWILLPFLVSILWGAIIVVATWPLLERLQARIANKRGLAVLLMSMALLLIVLLPVLFAVMTIAKNAQNITAQVRSFDFVALSSPPEWLSHIPFAGERIASKWRAFVALSADERYSMLAPYAQRALQWFVARAGSTGTTIVHFLLAMIIAMILYARGEKFLEGLLNFARRLGGGQGEEVTLLAGKAIRGIVLGIVVTALTQAAVGSIGLFVTGVPAAGLLTAVMLILCLAQIGPLLVLIPSVIWFYWSQQPASGTVLLIFSVFAGTIDNFLRPYLIKKGADLPLLLVIAGVIGGLISFGIIGLFIGPVILAIAFTLFTQWVSEHPQTDAPSAG